MHATPPPPYVMLGGQGQGSYGGLPPPPYHRNIPRYNHKKSSSGCCYRCLCCFYCLLLLLILIVAGTVLYIYIFFNPKPPSYKVSNFDVKAFDVQPDFSLNALFLATVNAENPNRGFGVVYEEGSSVVVLYEDSSLCSGKLPHFLQGPMNTTAIHVELKGKSKFGSGLQQAYSDSRKQGKIPILVVVKAPVTIVVSGLRSKQFVVRVNCSLVLDSLSPNKKVKILSSSYTFDASL